MSSDQVEEQVAAWKRAIDQGHLLEPVEVAKRELGVDWQMAVVAVTRLGDSGFDPHRGPHPVLKVVLTPGVQVEEHSGQLREELDKIGWQFITILNDDPQTPQRRFAMAPVTPREATVTYHTTLASTWVAIQRDGLVPSNPAIRQTNFPDTEGKIHVCKAPTGDGSGSSWVRIFCNKNQRKPEEYAILRVDLSGLGARVYQDVRSQYGLIVDRIDRIPPDRIRLERVGQATDLS